MKHALIQHQRKVVTARDEEDFQRINVRRSHLFDDALCAFSKPTFDVRKMLKVNFIGDSAAVDDGGPWSEFFFLLAKEIFLHSGLFCGWPYRVVVVQTIQALASNKYYVIGKILSASLIQGGQPPSCFCGAIADFLVYGVVRSPTDIKDIPDYDIQQLLFQVYYYDCTATFSC